MYTNLMDKSLASSKEFIKSLTTSQLEDLMKEFNNYEIERCNSGFYNRITPHYWHKISQFFDKDNRKSVNLKETHTQGLNEVLIFSSIFSIKYLS